MKNNIFYRKDKIVELCSKKTVLHLGFIEHSDVYEKKIQENNWLHNKIHNVASRLVGIDYLEKEIEILRKKFNYECYYGNVMELNKLKLNEKFDIIICGELIEHIENPGLMLDGIKQFMHENSILIITTPNPWSKIRIRLIRQNKLENTWLNQEHVSWYTYQTLKQLLSRKNFNEVCYGFYEAENSSKSNKLIDKIKNFIKLSLKIFSKKYFNEYDGLFFIAKK